MSEALTVEQYYQLPHINLTGPVGEKMLEDLDRQIKVVEPAQNSEFIVTLATGGGSVGYARSIYSELKLLQQHANPTLVVRGICLSAGVTLAMAFPHERRYALQDAEFLIHEGSLTLSQPITGPLSARNVIMDNVNSSHENDHREDDFAMRLIARGCKQHLRDVRKEAKKGLWLQGQEAIDYGLIREFLG